MQAQVPVQTKAASENTLSPRSRQCLTQEEIVLILLTHVNYFINFALKFSPFLWGMLIMC